MLFIAGLCISLCTAQDVKFTGLVTDSLQNPIIDVNVTAIPEDKGLKVSYTTTDTLGTFELSLHTNHNYTILFTHIGYFTKKVSSKTFLNIKKTIILNERIEKLDEVTINYKPPITIKKDTTIYDTEAFLSGEERKLRELLKKLPGIAVDREGNVTAQGKKVTKVLVEDKIFFTGDGKLAVNNIPADAVSQIEILDDYNEVSFLKGLQDSDDMAMNIRLKEDKKKFAFGDLEVGVGNKDRYLAHPTLFYYSPKTNINLIGDFSNTGQKSFTVNDYLEFEGGFGKLMGDMKSYFTLFSDDFAQYLGNSNFKANTNRFGALNLRQTLTSKTDVNAYFIASGGNTETETRMVNEYISSNPFTENRAVTNKFNNIFAIGKLTLDYEPSAKEDLALNTFVKVTDNNSNGIIETVSPFQDNSFQTLGTLKGVNLKQNLEYSKKFSRAQTISTEVTLTYQRNRPNTQWITDARFLDNLIPLEDDVIFDVFQQKETENTTFDLIVKDYWVLNNRNHIYTTIGANLVFENYTTHEEQRLSEGAINSFSNNGFGNDLTYRFNDTFLGVEYKFLVGIFTVKPALFYHNYLLKNEQFGASNSNATALLLPNLNVEAKFNNSEELNFRYGAKANFPNAPRLVNNFLLTDFNQVFKGNDNLANERYHSFSLSYYKFNLFRGLNLNAGVYYNKKTQSTKSTTELQGIDQFRTLSMFYLPENRVSGRFNFSKKINAFKFGLESNASYNEFFQIVNSNTSKNISKTFSNTGKMETFFKNAPNFELGYTHSPSTYQTNFSTAQFVNKEFFANLDYVFFKDFQLKVDYSRIDYQNKDAGITSVFDIANTSLFYQKEDSAWGFEIEATNLFDTRFKQRNSFADFLINDRSTFILPRIVMFKVSYKL